MSETKTVTVGDKNSVGKEEVWCVWYNCPNCYCTNIRNGYGFCPDCGIEVVWLKGE